MKKKILIISIFILLLILLIPIPNRLRDGGSVQYNAILYNITKVKRLNLESTTGYSEGIIVRVLGREVFNNVSYDVIVKVLDIDGVSMEVMDGTLTSTGMKVIIKDINEEKYVYGEEFFIEKKVKDKWIRLTPVVDDYGFNEMGYLVGDSNTLVMVQDWSYIYGPLDKGSYRLIKNIFDNGYKYFSVEFEI